MSTTKHLGEPYILALGFVNGMTDALGKYARDTFPASQFRIITAFVGEFQDNIPLCGVDIRNPQTRAFLIQHASQVIVHIDVIESVLNVIMELGALQKHDLRILFPVSLGPGLALEFVDFFLNTAEFPIRYDEDIANEILTKLAQAVTGSYKQPAPLWVPP